MNIEISIVIPCLNEARTVGHCVSHAVRYLKDRNLAGEVVVADNGSEDGSIDVARNAGARVVVVPTKGYGAALRGGIAAASGAYIVMGDGDHSYDFSRLDGFIDALRQNSDLVIGNRFKGGIAPGAMPFLHRYLGNPVLSLIGRIFFRIPVGDFHCGLRAFRKQAIESLALTANGMEFASEMIVKAALARFRIAEVPTTLSRDGRDRPSHLRTWRDGWRHLRFLLMFSPRWLFLYPGLTLLGIGTTLQLLLLHGGFQLGALGLDIHTMLYGAAMSIIGVQMVWFAIFSKVFGMIAGFLPRNSQLEQALRAFTLERGVVVGVVLLLSGLGLSARAVFGWADVSYGSLDPREVMRVAIPAVAMMITGIEFILASFFLGILRIENSEGTRPNAL